MKNRKFEQHRRTQKEYGRKPNQRLENGIVVRHLYGLEHQKPLSWWDDTGFNLNGVRVSIWWTHPRMGFSDGVNSLVHQLVPYPEVPLGDDWFDDSEKIFKKVGKSGKRKKVIAYRCKPDTNLARKQWYLDVERETARLLKESDLVIKPTINIESLSWCRGVSICAPLEVHCVNDLHRLCDLVRKLLSGKTTLALEFPDYAYSKDNWATENSESQQPTACELSQAVKI